MKIEYFQGDLFALESSLEESVLIPHICNDQKVWGKGFVVPLANQYPITRKVYLDWCKETYDRFDELIVPCGDFSLGNNQFIRVTNNKIVVNMLAQTLGGTRPLYYDKLVQCMNNIAEFMNVQSFRIVCPMFGSGLAKGDWNIIKELIQDCWIRENIPVTVCYFEENLPQNLKLS